MRIFLQNKKTVIRNISDKTTECMTVFLYFYYVSNISSNVTYYLSFARLQSAPLATVVATVRIKFYFHIRFLQNSLLRKAELDIFDI